MPWARLESTIYANPKILSLSDGAFRLYVLSLAWSVDHLTDGRVPESIIRVLCGSVRAPKRLGLCAELVNNLLWKPLDNSTYQIHDFDVYQPSKAQVERARSANRERQSRWRNGVSNGVSNAAPSHPIELLLEDPTYPQAVDNLGELPAYSRSEVRQTPCPECGASGGASCREADEPRRANHRERVAAHHARLAATGQTKALKAARSAGVFAARQGVPEEDLRAQVAREFKGDARIVQEAVRAFRDSSPQNP